MQTGRHKGHRGPSITDKARTARAVAKAADLAPILAELRGGSAGEGADGGRGAPGRRQHREAAGVAWEGGSQLRIEVSLSGKTVRKITVIYAIRHQIRWLREPIAQREPPVRPAQGHSEAEQDNPSSIQGVALARAPCAIG
jgi:hypothetical protein